MRQEARWEYQRAAAKQTKRRNSLQRCVGGTQTSGRACWTGSCLEISTTSEDASRRSRRKSWPKNSALDFEAVAVAMVCFDCALISMQKQKSLNLSMSMYSVDVVSV